MKVCVIGGGPAGIMAAITASGKNNEVILLEKNSELGKKLNITGKGRCNITYNGDNQYFLDNVITNSKFMISSINAFDNNDLIHFVNELGVGTKLERGNRFFLSSDNAKELSLALYKKIKEMNIKILFNSSVKKINVACSSVKSVELQSGETIEVDKLVIATGGNSYPGTGSTGDGYTLAKQLGHTVTKIKPALVPFILYEKEECKALEGLALKNVAVKVYKSQKLIDERFGEALFTNKGISGPIILSSSSKLNKIENICNLFKERTLKLIIDLKPALNNEELYKRITRDFDKYKNKEYKNSLGDLLPKSMIPIIVNRSKIAPSKMVNGITKEEKLFLVNTIKNLEFTIEDFESMYTGIVTSGGISVKEINPKTMESKIISGLYFAGEVIDVDAYTGGFNLQIAFSTGYVAGKSIKEGCEELC